MKFVTTFDITEKVWSTETKVWVLPNNVALPEGFGYLSDSEKRFWIEDNCEMSSLLETVHDRDFLNGETISVTTMEEE